MICLPLTQTSDLNTYVHLRVASLLASPALTILLTSNCRWEKVNALKAASFADGGPPYRSWTTPKENLQATDRAGHADTNQGVQILWHRVAWSGGYNAGAHSSPAPAAQRQLQL